MVKQRKKRVRGTFDNRTNFYEWGASRRIDEKKERRATE